MTTVTADAQLNCVEIPKIQGMPAPDAVALMRAYEMAVFPWDASQATNKHLGNLLGRGYHERATQTTSEYLYDWWTKNAGVSGVGWSVGRSGCAVLDVDRPDKVPAALRDFILDTRPPFHRSRVQEHNGIERGHYVYRVPAGVKVGNAAKWLGGQWGEVRSWNGGIACAPGSHSAGGKYEWVRTGVIPVLPRHMIPPLYKATTSVSSAEVNEFCRVFDETGYPGWLARQYDNVTAKYEIGSRHNLILGASINWFEAAAKGWCAGADVRAKLEELFYELGKDDDSELERITTRGVGTAVQRLKEGRR